MAEMSKDLLLDWATWLTHCRERARIQDRFGAPVQRHWSFRRCVTVERFRRIAPATWAVTWLASGRFVSALSLGLGRGFLGEDILGCSETKGCLG